MDNLYLSAEERSILETLAAYEPYPAFQHIDIRGRYEEPKEGSWLDYACISPAYATASTVLGDTSANLYYDEFVDSGIATNAIVGTLNSCQPRYTIDFDPTDYEVIFENGSLKIVKKEKEAPDFGELSPSQELSDFVDTLIQGE